MWKVSPKYIYLTFDCFLLTVFPPNSITFVPANYKYRIKDIDNDINLMKKQFYFIWLWFIN